MDQTVHRPMVCWSQCEEAIISLNETSTWIFSGLCDDIQTQVEKLDSEWSAAGKWPGVDPENTGSSLQESNQLVKGSAFCTEHYFPPLLPHPLLLPPSSSLLPTLGTKSCGSHGDAQQEAASRAGRPALHRARCLP